MDRLSWRRQRVRVEGIVGAPRVASVTAGATRRERPDRQAPGEEDSSCAGVNSNSRKAGRATHTHTNPRTRETAPRVITRASESGRPRVTQTTRSSPSKAKGGPSSQPIPHITKRHKQQTPHPPGQSHRERSARPQSRGAGPLAKRHKITQPTPHPPSQSHRERCERPRSRGAGHCEVSEKLKITYDGERRLEPGPADQPEMFRCS